MPTFSQRLANEKRAARPEDIKEILIRDLYAQLHKVVRPLSSDRPRGLRTYASVEGAKLTREGYIS